MHKFLSSAASPNGGSWAEHYANMLGRVLIYSHEGVVTTYKSSLHAFRLSTKFPLHPNLHICRLYAWNTDVH